MPATFRFALLFLSALLTACVATPEASSPQNAVAESFAPVPGQAVLYVYRLSFNSNSVIIQVNGNIVGESLPGTYFRIVAPPGDQTVQGVDADQGSIRLNVAAGAIGYVRNEPGGVSGEVQSNFRIVPAGEARAEILRCCTLLDNYAPGQRRLLF